MRGRQRMDGIGSPDARLRSPLRQRLWAMVVVVFMGGLTSCAASPGSWISGGNAEDGDRTDPYVQFTQAVTAVEPLVSPELEALARSQRDGSGQTNSDQSSVLLPKVVPLEVDEDLAIATSPQLLSLNEQMYEQFIQAGYRGIMDINAISTSQAIRQFCQTSVPGILTISRSMTAAESTSCQAQQRSPIGIPFGKDALVLAVNQQNDFLQGITLETLKAMLTQSNWSAVKANWPQRPIIRYLIGPDSSTVSLLSTTLFNGTNAIAPSANTQYFEDEESMLQSLRATSDGIGILSYATFRRSPSIFKTLPINGITASQDTISQGTYPLGQTLYLYVDQRHVTQQASGEKAQLTPLTHWVNFYLTHINENLPKSSLLPLISPQFDSAKNQWMTLSRPSTEDPPNSNTNDAP